MTTITFEGRSPKPHTIAIGMQGEHNAETIRLEGLPEFGTAVLNVVLPDGTGDLMTITDGTVTFTRNQTQKGTMTAWVTVQDGTDIVWKSEKMYLAVGELPEIDGPVEQRYPGYVEDTIAEMTEIASQTVAAKDAVFGMSAEAQTLPAGESATASYSQGVMHFGIPTGPKGDAFTYSDFTQEQLAALTGPQGPDGHTPSFSIGTVESGASAAATITGTDADPILNLTLPKGDKGENGVPANIGVGSVTTGEPGTDADVTISGTGEAGYELNFTIPRGTPGAGNVSEVRGEKGLTGTVTSSGALKADLKDETKFVNASLNPKETTTRMYPVSLDSNGKLVCSVPYPTYAAGAGLDAIYSIPVPATIVTPEGTRQYYTSTQDVTFNLDVSGATAGTYGPAWDVTGENGSTINVPQITVDKYGRVTSINNKILTCVDTQGNGLPSGGADGDLVTKEYGAGAWTSRIAREYSTSYTDEDNQIIFGRTNPYSDQDQGGNLWNDWHWGRPVHFFFEHDEEDPDYDDGSGILFLKLVALYNAGYEGGSPYEVYYIKLERLLPNLTTRTRYFRVYYDDINQLNYVMQEITN